MSLYGSGRRYTMGAVRNAQLAPVIYPLWTLRFYCESSSPLRRFPLVPARWTYYLGPFHGAIAVPSVTRCRCRRRRRRRGHRCAGGVRRDSSDTW